jgi:transposase, IS30 family
VGISRKTGYRWRAENGGIPPVRLTAATRTSRHLSLLERQRIAALRGRGHGIRKIARRIGRSPSTVSRKLRRNLRPHNNDAYDGDLAHARARRIRQARLARDQALRQVAQAKLGVEWSPQQIAAHLRVAYPDRPNWHVCHESIYQALDHSGKGGLSQQHTRRLRTGRPLRKRRRRPDTRRVRLLARRCCQSTGPPRWSSSGSGLGTGEGTCWWADEPVSSLCT